MIKPLFYPLLLLTVLLSCGQPNATYHDINNQAWSNTDTLYYDVSAEQINGLDKQLIIRHTSDYYYQNIWLKISCQPKGQMPVFDRYEIQLAAPNGHWLGRRAGAIISREVALNDLTCGADSCRIAIVQNMRQNPLNGIQSVGLAFP